MLKGCHAGPGQYISGKYPVDEADKLALSVTVLFNDTAEAFESPGQEPGDMHL